MTTNKVNNQQFPLIKCKKKKYSCTNHWQSQGRARRRCSRPILPVVNVVRRPRVPKCVARLFSPTTVLPSPSSPALSLSLQRGYDRPFPFSASSVFLLFFRCCFWLRFLLPRRRDFTTRSVAVCISDSPFNLVFSLVNILRAAVGKGSMREVYDAIHKGRRVAKSFLAAPAVRGTPRRRRGLVWGRSKVATSGSEPGFVFLAAPRPTAKRCFIFFFFRIRPFGSGHSVDIVL